MEIMKQIAHVGLYILATVFGIGVITLLGSALAIAIMSGIDILLSIVLR